MNTAIDGVENNCQTGGGTPPKPAGGDACATVECATTLPELNADGFSLSNAMICAEACEDSYSEQSAVSGEQSGSRPGVGTHGSQLTSPDSFITDQATDTHVLLREYGEALIVAFRGSASLRNWLTDFDAHREAIAHMRVQQGFYEAYCSVSDALVDAIGGSAKRIVFLTGHSLGGALAAIAGVVIENSKLRIQNWGPDSKRIEAVYTFGQPRVGDKSFAEDAECCGIAARHYRVTNRADIVPWLPGWLMGYRHFGQHIHFDALGMHVTNTGAGRGARGVRLGEELLVNGLEIWREFRRGQAAMLTDHAIARCEEALATERRHQMQITD